MLLSSAPIGEAVQIKAIWGENSIRDSLAHFGLAIDAEVHVISKIFDDVFVIGIQDRRIAMDEELARKIMIEPSASVKASVK